MELYIDNRQDIEINKETEDLIKKAIEKTLEYEEVSLDYEVSLSFVDNLEIRELNRDYRGIDKETDVLSFPMEDDFPLEGQLPFLGDIIISLEKTRDQAQDYGHSFIRELIYLTVHSSLHLLGYDHIDQEEKKLMRSKEEAIMDILNIKRG